MRPHLLFARLHRYAGLTMAGFLVVAGLTGSIIAFHQELDAALNPGWFVTAGRGTPLSPETLARAARAAVPGAEVTLVPTRFAPGETARIRLTSQGSGLFDEIFLDPTTGRVLGERAWGACCFARERLVPFLYRVHYSLALPGVWGLWLMGGISLLWSLDCFTAFLRTLPANGRWRQWRKAWTFKRGAGRHRFTVDLHRVFGLWLWAMLLMLAFSGAALTLPQVVRPIVALVSPLSAPPTALPAPPVRPGAAKIDFDRALHLARARLARLGRPAEIHALMRYGNYGALYARPGADGDSGLGYSVLYLDAYGTPVADVRPEAGSPGDRFLALQYPLHSGRLFGRTGRIAVALMGLVVATLAVTGVLIWFKKRRGRRIKSAQTTDRPAGHAGPSARSG